MRIDNTVARLYLAISKEKDVPVRQINEIMDAYYKSIASIMRNTAEGKIKMPFFGKMLFNTYEAEKGALSSIRVKHKIEQARKKKPLTIYELLGVRRRDTTT